MNKRVIGGIGVAVFIVLSIFHMPVWLAGLFMLAFSVVLMNEFYDLFRAADPPFPIFNRVGTGCGLALLAVVFVNGLFRPPEPDLERFVIFASVALIMIRQFPQKFNTQPIMTIAGTLFGFFYVAYLLTYIIRLMVFDAAEPGWRTPIGPAGRFLLLFLVVTVKASDAGAYFIGCRFGRNKLFPRISPQKTWEGLMGGVVTGMAAGYGIFRFMGEGAWGLRRFGTLELHAADILCLAFLLTVLGAVGDLVESLIKRAVAVKDSGKLLPGMGGMLDMFDSVLYTAPVLYFFVRAFAA